MSHRFTLEKRMRVYDDDTGVYIEVREDSDGLELLEIVQSDSKQCLVIPVAQARLLCKGIEEVAQHIEARQKEQR